jgi:hypothetical protein
MTTPPTPASLAKADALYDRLTIAKAHLERQERVTILALALDAARAEGVRACTETKDGHISHVEALQVVDEWLEKAPLSPGIGYVQDVVERSLRASPEPAKGGWTWYCEVHRRGEGTTMSNAFLPQDPICRCPDKRAATKEE